MGRNGRKQASKRERARRRNARIKRYERLAGQRQVFKAANALDREFRYVVERDEEETSPTPQQADRA